MASPSTRSSAGFSAAFQSLWATLGTASLILGTTAALLRIFPPTDDLAALYASFIPWGFVADLIAVVCFGIALVRARRRWAWSILAGISAALLIMQISWQGPLFIADDRPATTPPFTMMSLNLLNGSAAPQQVVDHARQADLVVLAEHTSAEAERLHELGWDELFPYSAGDPRSHGTGTAIYSRFPLSDELELGPTTYQQWRATAHINGIGPVMVMAVRPCNPLCGRESWSRDHAVIRQQAQPLLDQRLVIAGDFNAIDDHGPMRALKRDGLKSATDIAGAGWFPTYPAKGPIPPVMPIDHMLLSQSMTALSIDTFAVQGTDHRGLLARLAGSR